MIHFDNRVARKRANIIASQCKDLGMVEIRQLHNGRVQARLADQLYLFDWDHTHQTMMLIWTQEYVEVSPMRCSQDSFPMRAEQHSAGIKVARVPEGLGGGRTLVDEVEGFEPDPGSGPRAAVRKREFVEPVRRRISDAERRAAARAVDQARATRKALASVRF